MSRKRPMRWRHIRGTIWGRERWELWRGEDLFATVISDKRYGSGWWACSKTRGVELRRVEWSLKPVEEAQADAKAYVVEQLARGESNS